MQLFRTTEKGWGLRCLDDIHKGTFVCTYAGHLLTEEQSDLRGQVLSDTYFAELDFLDCLKRLIKESAGESTSQTESSCSVATSVTSDEDSSLSKWRKLNTGQKRNIPAIMTNSPSLNQSVRYQRPRQRTHKADQSINIQPSTSANNEAECETICLGDSDDEEEAANMTNVQSNESNSFFDKLQKQYNYLMKDQPECFIMDAKLLGNIGR